MEGGGDGRSFFLVCLFFSSGMCSCVAKFKLFPWRLALVSMRGQSVRTDCLLFFTLCGGFNRAVNSIPAAICSQWADDVHTLRVPPFRLQRVNTVQHWGSAS